MLAGDGVAKAPLKAEAQRRGLTQLEFLDAYPYEQVPTVLSAADALLVSLKKTSISKGVVPAKLFEALAAERPILLAGDGEARELAVRQAQGALFVEPENGAALAAAIQWLRAHPTEAQALGANGRAYAQAHLDREMLADVLVERIYQAMGRRASKIPRPTPQPPTPAAPAMSQSPMPAAPQARPAVRESMLAETLKRPVAPREPNGDTRHND